MTPPDVSVIVLTMGNRSEELAALVRSVRRQRDVAIEVILVENGAPGSAEPISDEIDVVVTSTENVGIPAGRNLGARAASADVLVFLDDDGELVGDDAIRVVSARLGHDRVAVVAMRIVDEAGLTARRHVPRLGRRGVSRAGFVTSFLGGACAMRRTAFDEVGGYDERFFYAMEETDLSWRLIAGGWSLWYEPSARLVHPATVPARHSGHVRQTMRNRVWAAFTSLPHPLSYLYVADWAVLAVARDREPAAVVSGLREAWPTRSVKRSPMTWRSVARLARLGRPPVV